MKTCALLFYSCLSVLAGEPAFHNRGTLDGFTGGNQRAKLSVSSEQDADGNGTSIRCLMVRAEPDVPGGCHAEVHLHRLPGGRLLGTHPGFSGTTIYQIYFDKDCDAASVGFFQYKNCEGPERWRHLIAMWRSPAKDGAEITFQIKPAGESIHYHARLDDASRLVAGKWHTVRVDGWFSKDSDGWAEVRINGTPVTWFRDKERKLPLGTRITGANLPAVPRSEWQLQLGGYGFFKDRTTPRAVVFIDDIRAFANAETNKPPTKP